MVYVYITWLHFIIHLLGLYWLGSTQLMNKIWTFCNDSYDNCSTKISTLRDEW